jgi:hypothetical protein
MVMSRYAIKGSPNQKLLLEDIYYAIESRVRRHFSVHREIMLSADATSSSSRISELHHLVGK